MAKRPESQFVSSVRAEATELQGRSLRSAPIAYASGAAVLAAVLLAFRGPESCVRQPPPGATQSSNDEIGARRIAAWPARAGSRSSASSEVPSASEVALVGSMVTSAPIYSGMEALRDKRIGYIRQGGRAQAYAAPVQAPNCEAGWYHLVGGGFVCSKFVTLDLNNPLVRLGTSPPNTDDLLPYRYVRNLTMGTPLYRSVPSRQQVAQSEPYLRPSHLPSPPPERARPEKVAPEPAQEDDNPYLPVATAAPEPSKEPPKTATPIEFDFGKADLKLSDLEFGPGSIIARRLVKGFHIAVDKDFSWNDRTWLKTTTGMVAPADRFADATPSTLRGVELANTDPMLSVGFLLGTQASKYHVDPDKRQVLALGPVERFTSALLTGRVAELPNGTFRETIDGWWMKASDSTYTAPGSPPEDLGEGEKWIDVNLSRQTLVAFEGKNPVYAALVASGRHAADPNDKLHDHRTITGMFRIREKHLTITMDGDGPAPGDMPYSIEDVPYVMYFEGSYALHAAFWHSNFGHETSHGCVNLAPLDAKRLFFWTEPRLPEGWHGVIASDDNRGTRVIVHE